MIFGAEFRRDPYPAYRWLRDNAPCHRVAPGVHALSRYDDVLTALRDPMLFSSAFPPPAGGDAAPRNGEVGGAAVGGTVVSGGPIPSLLFLDPPEHQELRKAVSRGFTRQAVDRLETAVHETVAELLDAAAARGGGDAVTDVAAPLSVAVVMRVLGVPAADRDRVGTLLSPSAPPGADAELRSYWHDLSASLRAGRAGSGVVAELVRPGGRPEGQDRTRDGRAGTARAGEGGPRDGHGGCAPLTDEQVAAFCALVAEAGTESAAMLLSNALVLLARHPEQWRTLCDDPEAIPAAVEEVLRFWAPTQHQGRTLTADAGLHGDVLPAGSRVLLLTGSASRDERAYPDPDVFDVHRFHPDRRPAAQLGFGFGVHFCLGAAVARLQARIALREFGERFPRFSVDMGALVRSDAANGFGHRRVPFSA